MTPSKTTRGFVVAVIGSTGVGKTKLGIAIAKLLETEVISIDSLQVYRPGGIMSAKVTPEEMDGVKHHLVDYLSADEEPDDFLHSAIVAIDDLHAQNRVPVLVGGSTSLTIPLIFDKLQPRYEVLVFRLWSEKSVLRPRLDNRIDEMLENGLLDELRDLYRLEKRLLEREDFGRGIWKAIGYRELYPYLASDGTNGMLLQDGISQMKENTELYAEAQVSWWESKLLPLLRVHRILHQSLEVTTSGRWQEDVEMPALRICASKLYDTPGAFFISGQNRMTNL